MTLSPTLTNDQKYPVSLWGHLSAGWRTFIPIISSNNFPQQYNYVRSFCCWSEGKYLSFGGVWLYGGVYNWQEPLWATG